jgi:hypothetical protein
MNAKHDVGLKGRLLALACVLVVSACGAHITTDGAGITAATSSAAPTLRTVTPQVLALNGVTLLAPNAVAEIRQSAAETTALTLYAADRVLESVLAEVVRPGLSDQLCWIVSLPPQFAPRAHPPIPYLGTRRPLPPNPTYLLVFIDARTGAPLWAASGNELGVTP